MIDRPHEGPLLSLLFLYAMRRKNNNDDEAATANTNHKNGDLPVIILLEISFSRLSLSDRSFARSLSFVHLV